MSTDVKQQIVALLQANQPARAKKLCLELAATDPHTLILLANAQLQLGEFEAAMDSARRAIVDGWKDPRALVMLVALLLQRSEKADAEYWFAKLCRLVHDESEARRRVAVMLHKLGQHDTAIEQLSKAVEREPGNFLLRHALGGLLQETRHYEAAASQYEYLLAGDPANIQVLCRLGSCLNSLKQFDRAIGVLQQAQAIDPVDPMVNFHLGETLQNQNRFREAIASYRCALEASPDSARLHGSLARAQRCLGDLEGALQSLRHAQALEPANATVYNDLGICLYDDSNLEPARQAFAEAVRLNPGIALSRFYLGMVLDQGGDNPGADRQFSEAIRLWPYVEPMVDSYRYARNAAASARYFSTHKQIFEYAIGRAPENGLFLEFGVYHGTSINLIARLTPATVHGFDTFQGLPTDWLVEHGGRREVEPAGFYSTHGRLPEAPGNVRYHVGTFDETLPGFCAAYPGPVSFVNIDCDLYESTQSVFRHLGGRIQPGSVLVFDEYLCLPGWRKHEYRAFQEYLAGSGLDYEYLAFNLFTGQAVVRIQAA